MPYSPNGRAHKALALLVDGEKPMSEVRTHIAKTDTAEGYRKTWRMVGAMLDDGLITRGEDSVWITLAGRLALKELNEGFSWEAPKPTVRVFVARAA